MEVPDHRVSPAKDRYIALGRLFIGYIEAESSITAPVNIKHVPMNSSSHIDIPKGQQGMIYTDGLCGCSAIAVATLNNDGNRQAYMQHYSPDRQREGIDRLSSYLVKMAPHADEQTLEVAVMTPGIKDPHEPNMELPEDMNIDLVVALTLESFSQRSQLRTILYDKHVDFNIFKQGRTMAVQAGSSGIGMIISS